MCSLGVRPFVQSSIVTSRKPKMSSDEWEDAAQLASLSPKRSSREGPGSRAGSRPTSPRPVSPRNQRLGADVGTALQSAVEGMMQGDLLDTSVVVDLANSHEAQRKMDDLLPIHFLSWNLKSVQAALVYTLLHMFVLLNQYREVVGERGTYQEYISQLKSRLAQLEDELQQAKQGGVRGSERGEGDSGSRDELLRLRRENAELRQEQARLQASQDEVIIVTVVYMYLCKVHKWGFLLKCFCSIWCSMMQQ